MYFENLKMPNGIVYNMLQVMSDAEEKTSNGEIKYKLVQPHF